MRAIRLLDPGSVPDTGSTTWRFSGDFTMLPASGLAAPQQGVRGSEIDLERLTARAQSVYRNLGLESPGLDPSHFAAAVLQAAAPSSP